MDLRYDFSESSFMYTILRMHRSRVLTTEGRALHWVEGPRERGATPPWPPRVHEVREVGRSCED